MFKKRLRSAKVLFFGLLVLTAVFAGYFAVTARGNLASSELNTLYGDSSEIEGIYVNLTTNEIVNNDIISWYMIEASGENAQQKYLDYMEGDESVADAYFRREVSMDVSDGKLFTNQKIKKTEEEKKERIYYAKSELVFPQEKREGTHLVTGSEISGRIDVVMNNDYLSIYADDLPVAGKSYKETDYVTFAEQDSFLYYYDGLGPKTYEAFALQEKQNTEGRPICFVDGVMYGYLDAGVTYEFLCNYKCSETVSEPNEAGHTIWYAATAREEIWDFEETCEKITDKEFSEQLAAFGKPEITMTVNKGIYRFDENQEMKCVLKETDFAEDFSFLCLTANDENRTLTVIGSSKNCLVAYEYFIEQETVVEHVLWEDAEGVKEWIANAENVDRASIYFDGAKSYLVYIKPLGIGYHYRVVVTAFEDGERVYEGELLGESDRENIVLKDFSMDANGVNDVSSFVEKIEIGVER